MHCSAVTIGSDHVVARLPVYRKPVAPHSSMQHAACSMRAYRLPPPPPQHPGRRGGGSASCSFLCAARGPASCFRGALRFPFFAFFRPLISLVFSFSRCVFAVRLTRDGKWHLVWPTRAHTPRTWLAVSWHSVISWQVVMSKQADSGPRSRSSPRPAGG